MHSGMNAKLLRSVIACAACALFSLAPLFLHAGGGSEEDYLAQGKDYVKNGDFGYAIACYNKAIAIDPRLAEAYYGRAVAYYNKEKLDEILAVVSTDFLTQGPPDHVNEYDDAWRDLYRAQELGYKVDTGFLEKLKKDSGRIE